MVFVSLILLNLVGEYAELSAGVKFSMSLWPLLAVWIGSKTLAEFEVTGVFTEFSITVSNI